MHTFEPLTALTENDRRNRFNLRTFGGIQALLEGNIFQIRWKRTDIFQTILQFGANGIESVPILLSVMASNWEKLRLWFVCEGNLRCTVTFPKNISFPITWTARGPLGSNISLAAAFSEREIQNTIRLLVPGWRMIVTPTVAGHHIFQHPKIGSVESSWTEEKFYNIDKLQWTSSGGCEYMLDFLFQP